MLGTQLLQDLPRLRGFEGLPRPCLPFQEDAGRDRRQQQSGDGGGEDRAEMETALRSIQPIEHASGEARVGVLAAKLAQEIP
jgi:hypothetical protein